MTTFPRGFAVLSTLLLAGVAACAAPRDDDAATQAGELSVDAALGEVAEEDEEAIVRRIADEASAQLANAHRAAGGVAKRDAHPKAHGCVTASFTVADDIPADMRVGTFVPGKRYDAWIRFSNGSQADDRSNDARGMAIKVMGVDGPRLLASEGPGARTHDFVLSNHHTFFLDNLADYVRFMETVTTKGNPISFFLSWNPLELHLRAAWLARKFTTQPISDPLTSRYWSVTSYALGRRPVKYSATPCDGADTSGEHPDAADYLGQAMKAHLAGRDACFTFSVQRQTTPAAMPVEDPTVTWDEDASPFVPVGRVTIPRQTFDGAAQQTFCENLSFTPWHATQAHRPLGSTNRARKVVYEATSSLRHRLNGAPRVEPSSLVVPGGR